MNVSLLNITEVLLLIHQQVLSKRIKIQYHNDLRNLVTLKSKNSYVRKLFGSVAMSEKNANDKSNSNKNKTLCHIFKMQLDNLMTTLGR